MNKALIAKNPFFCVGKRMLIKKNLDKIGLCAHLLFRTFICKGLSH
ncbi:hypothetical protein M2480_000537 [Parabacteroides sp. PFB2-12]|nr:hypothetical protein [Parabacteroides sp. PM6-13]MDH6389577.1 hypothetical protein [Parabacteroides sp. PFB2-12]